LNYFLKTKLTLTSDERSQLIKEIVERFRVEESIKICLPNGSYLTLTRNESKKDHNKRYFNTPFPLLSNVEEFSTKVGA
jgi:hypothetical protein